MAFTHSLTRHSFAGLTLLAWAASLGGCAVRSSDAQTSAPAAGKVTSLDDESPVPEQPEISSTSADAESQRLETLDDAERAYATAQRKLDSLLGNRTNGLTEGTPEHAEPEKPASPLPAPSAGAAPLKKADDRCKNVCLALASLERARDAICRITSETDERCTKATTSLDKNRERARVCACPESSTRDDE